MLDVRDAEFLYFPLRLEMFLHDAFEPGDVIFPDGIQDVRAVVLDHRGHPHLV